MVVIRQGEERDVQKIVNISKEYIDRDSRNGNGSFLIRELLIDDVTEHIHEFYVALHMDEVVGYVWINHSYPLLRVDHTIFEEPVDLNNVVYIKQVAVQSSFSGKGIASQLYGFVRKNNVGKKMIACVAVEPLKNEPSIRFHMNNAFRKIGELSLRDYLGFDLYKAYVFLQN